MDRLLSNDLNDNNLYKKRKLNNTINNQCNNGMETLLNMLIAQDNKINIIYQEIIKINSNCENINNNINDKFNKLINKINKHINDKIDLLDVRICRIINDIDSIKKEIIDLQTHALHGSFYSNTTKEQMDMLDTQTYQDHYYCN